MNNRTIRRQQYDVETRQRACFRHTLRPSNKSVTVILINPGA